MVRPRFELGDDTEVRAKQCRADLGDELFACALGLVPGIAAQIAANPIGPRGPVDCFVTEHGDVGFGVPECLEGRHLDVIACRRVECPGAAMPDHGPGIGEEPVGMFNPLDRIDDLLGPVVVVIGKPVDLIAIENRVRLEKRNIAFQLLALRVRLGFREPARIDDRRAGFALADLCADLRRLRRFPRPGPRASWSA